MAITLLSAPLAGLRGTLGALTYSANGSGTYVKTFRKGPNAQTQRQMIERSFLAALPALWNALTPIQRAAWDTFAALPAQELTNSLGVAYYISGWLWFVKTGLRLNRVGRSIVAATPSIARPAAPTITDFRVALAGTDPHLCTAGTPSASTTNPGFPAANAFDDHLGTYWQTTIGITTGWLQYILSAAATIRQYWIYIGNYTYYENPRTWTFEAWNGASFDVLHTVTDWLPTANGWFSWDFPNETAYTQYRHDITATKNPAATSLIVYDVDYTVGLHGHSVITYPSAEFSSASWDLILHIAMTNSQAKTVQYPGYYEILADTSPGDFSTDLTDELVSVFGTTLPGRRWFAKLFRQTTEGLRSAPATSATNTLE